MELSTGLLFFVPKIFGPKINQFKKIKNIRNYVGNYCGYWQYEQLKCKSVTFVAFGSEWIKIESNIFVNLGSG